MKIYTNAYIMEILGMAKYGIKETLDVINLLQQISVFVREAVSDDGYINLKDIPKLFKLYASLREAIKDIDKVTLELKDLDSKETQLLLDSSIKTSVHLGQSIMKLFEGNPS